MPQKGKKTAEKAEKSARARWFGAIFYPESLPEKWEKLLNEKFQLQWACSPLHDKDVQDDGTPKKAHFHLAFYFKGKKSLDQVKEITDFFNQPPPIIIKNNVGTIRYFFHLDDPDKAQYDLSDFKSSGIDVLEIIQTSGDKKAVNLKLQKELKSIIEKFNFHDLISLQTFLEDNEAYDLMDWFRRHMTYTNSALKANWIREQREMNSTQNRRESNVKIIKI